MASITTRGNKLRLDFRYLGIRCREQTDLVDNAKNRRTLCKLLQDMDRDMRMEIFVYSDYFPHSQRSGHFTVADQIAKTKKSQVLEQYAPTMHQQAAPSIPLMSAFSDEWFDENEVRWKKSYKDNVTFMLDKYILPTFGNHALNEITRAQLLKFRAQLSKGELGTKVPSADFVNHVMTVCRMLITEAAERFEFRNPYVNIKPLKIPKIKITPFSLDEVKHFLRNVRADFKDYYTVRFFTGMRTSEIDGLQWKHVNLQTKTITVCEALVDGRMETPKTSGSNRTIMMIKPVYDALLSQQSVSYGKSDFVFCNNNYQPLNHRNVRKRVWIPALKVMSLAYRRPYSTRHTAATLMLSAGESPEFVAKTLGHSSTKMLFDTYSSYVANATRNDGSAFEAIINKE